MSHKSYWLKNMKRLNVSCMLICDQDIFVDFNFWNLILKWPIYVVIAVENFNFCYYILQLQNPCFICILPGSYEFIELMWSVFDCVFPLSSRYLVSRN